MNFKGPEYLCRALPYHPASVLDKEDNNGPHSWEFDKALAIVEEAINSVDSSSLPRSSCELSWPEGCEDIGRSTFIYQSIYGSYFPHENQLQHTPSVRVQRTLPPSCELTGPSRPTIDTDFDKWLEMRKYEWNAMRLQKQDSYAPPLEQDFYGWLNARKCSWRKQRAEKKKET